MRTRTYLLVLPFLAMACSSDPAVTPTDAGPDAKPKDGGSDATPPPDISGTTAFDITVVSNTWGVPDNDTDPGTPQAGVEVRLENEAGGFLEATTDSSGKATIKADATKGPFDVTVAKTGVGAASVLGVKAPADLTKKIWLPIPFVQKSYSMAGALNGKKSAANDVLIDAPWFETAFPKPNATTYGSRHIYVDADPTDVTVAAIEVDSTKTAVNAVMMPAVKRTQSQDAMELKSAQRFLGRVLVNFTDTEELSRKAGLYRLSKALTLESPEFLRAFYQRLQKNVGNLLESYILKVQEMSETDEERAKRLQDGVLRSIQGMAKSNTISARYLEFQFVFHQPEAAS